MTRPDHVLYSFYGGLVGVAAGFIDPFIVISQGQSPAILLITLVGSLLWFGLFWFVLQGRNWARIVLFVFVPFVLLAPISRAAPNGPEGSVVAAWCMAIPTVVAAALLLTPSSRRWFSTRREHAA